MWEEDTQILLDKNDYFRETFECKAREAQQSIINKPNWTKIVTDYIVSLICSSKTTIVTLQRFRGILIASNEILLDEIRVFGHDGNRIIDLLPKK